MKDFDHKVSLFWRRFSEKSTELAVADSANCPVYDQLLAALQEIHGGLFFEFCTGEDENELIVSAEGDTSLFPLVREIVAAAPAIDGWEVIALKPKIGMPVTAQWKDFTVHTDDVVFGPLERERSSDLGLRMYVPGLAPERVDDAHSALLRALDHALGEEQFAMCVQFTEVVPLPGDADVNDFIPLRDVDAFIDWRERKKADA